ncbi:SPFH domain-containing protein [Phaeobacter sp. QD34_3]|uniref:SPFH domain-containing protein n=1 Tax=unclassified Phaeobacter TaxID=2621772 RepID=UPI00237F9465|nr:MULTISPECIES: SPFH domain-containing protein [unclassified Phaeobacter]MDE4132631.1 SPFH domain-containing protein [Phaeobacter sp. QD34_3]MDE4136267.1 SPFH domain-containing protein [Phaeobacter sp. QD34_24]MDE4174373.1 SPFH domain-containing protein [Phaeobacter sp. PT47_59]
MLFMPILGLFIIAAGFVIRRSLDFPDNPNLDGAVNMAGWAVKVGGILLFVLSTFQGMFFYAEPGFKYHVRTILGEEKMVSDTGYNLYLFGRYNAWKNAMSVQASATGRGEVTAETDSSQMSANLSPKSLVFLDQVDAFVSATARFELPSDQEAFLRLARQYRTPENLLRTELVPAFEETLGATAALMSAEDYFQGGKTEFNNEFQRQMENGIYLVRRIEQRVSAEADRRGSANAALGENQEQYGDDSKTIFVVQKLLDETGQPRRKEQSFTKFGISVTSARVTDVNPNQKFKDRMALRQQAAADRAIAREQRIQEEEQKLLAVARGEREVAERQAAAKVIQIERTTDAETEKQLAITAAEREREAARIAREQSEILLEKARIDAEAVRVAAEAEAYAKQQILEADNALAQKLDAEVEIQRLWAEAFARRNVPTYVFGGGGAAEGGAPVGSDDEASRLFQILTLQAAERLDYDRNISQDPQK